MQTSQPVKQQTHQPVKQLVKQSTKQPIQGLIATLGQYNLLPQLQREIILETAINSVECTFEEIETAYQQMMEAVKDQKEQKRYACLQGNNLTRKEVLNLVQRKLKIDKFKQINWSDSVPAYFIKRKKQLDKLVYSRIAHADQGVATEIYFRLVEREQSFTELAREYSQAEEAQVHEIYNPVKVCTLDSPLAPYFTNKKPGDVLLPVNCHNVYLVMRLEQIIPAVLDAAMHQQLLDELFEQWLEAQSNQPQYRQLMLQKLTAWAV